MKVRLAQSLIDFERAYRLRYDAYVAHGDMPPNEFGLFKDELDEQPHSYLLLLFEDETDTNLIGTARCLVSDGSQPLGGSSLFSAELAALFESVKVSATHTVLEVTRVAICDEYRTSVSAISTLFCSIVEFSHSVHACYLVAPVRAKQMRAYQTLAGLSAISEERYCPKQKVYLRLMGNGGDYARHKVKNHFRFGEGVVLSDSLAENLFTFSTPDISAVLAGTPE